jgi:signal transduction histidine kinase
LNWKDEMDSSVVTKGPSGPRADGSDTGAQGVLGSSAGSRPGLVLKMPVHPLARLGGRPFRGVMPRRTVRLRLTALYGGLFLVSGAALLAITYLLVAGLPPAIAGRPFRPLGPPSRGGPAVALCPLSQGFQKVQSCLHAVALAQQSADLHGLLIRSGIALVIMAVISVWLGWLIAGRVLRPLQVITSTTRQISEENLHQRLTLPGPLDELTELGDTIDGLLGRLEDAFDAQRNFVANASHELRTPLAMMRTSLDVAEAKSPPVSQDASVLAGKVREGLDQADRLVESFLVLARAQRGVMTDLTTVCLPEVVSTALEARTADTADMGLTVRLQLGRADVTGSQTLLAQMVANLVGNAIRHNQPGGFIDVTTHADACAVRLIVENGGAVLDPDQVAQLSQPFKRLGADRTGSAGGVGLGLSIVAAIVAAHRGTLGLQPGLAGGLRALIELPQAGPPSPNGARG